MVSSLCHDHAFDRERRDHRHAEDEWIALILEARVLSTSDALITLHVVGEELPRVVFLLLRVEFDDAQLLPEEIGASA